MSSESYMSPETEGLIHRALAGDETAFNALLSPFEESLKRLIVRRIESDLVRRFDASDVLQETRLSVFQRLPEYFERRPMPFAIWLHKSALQQLATLRKFHVIAQKRSITRERTPAVGSSVQLMASLLVDKLTPSSIIAAGEKQRRLECALSELREGDRELLLLRYVEQYSNREVAMLLDITEPAASKRHGMALLRLQRSYKRLFPEDSGHG
ncbi:MAG: sigma-70 family RNA polymerase sigma factor [Planctomycetales bacterium]|nr:sigma-70 family RNA polymerase sigma factor [Planctomycetales bacterium]